jgi:hypothetical protein
MKKIIKKITTKQKPATKTKTTKVKEVAKKEILKDIPEVVLDEEEVEAKHEELDPEILEALNAKKKAAKKPTKFVDYIPELERGDDSFGSLDDASF